MQLSNPASAAGLVMTNHTRYAVPWLPIWPSITAEANATVRSVRQYRTQFDTRSIEVYRFDGRPLFYLPAASALQHV